MDIIELQVIGMYLMLSTIVDLFGCGTNALNLARNGKIS
jgi:hypothetical protein